MIASHFFSLKTVTIKYLIIIFLFVNEFHNADYVFYKENMSKIVIAKLGNDAGIIGSALYAQVKDEKIYIVNIIKSLIFNNNQFIILTNIK